MRPDKSSFDYADRSKKIKNLDMWILVSVKISLLGVDWSRWEGFEPEILTVG